MLGYAPLASADGDAFTFSVKAVDCAGNASAVVPLVICVDNQAPANSFTHFDAHPAHNGVWLNWSWEASANAQEMRIYRSPHSTEYPAYPNDQWNNPAEYDVFNRLLRQDGHLLQRNQARTARYRRPYTNQNNRGDALTTHVDGSETFWLDAETGWVDGDENSNSYRDVYRYVTFVRDAVATGPLGKQFQSSKMPIALYKLLVGRFQHRRCNR
ncbi:MAG: hypothetical protein IPP40_04635 [bacterium]|nr:hypothetical protein [bacterium]